ncbi:MAG: carboxymuconolactone decarboxylase family protein, partial [Rhizobiales bacterium]|nr:carboxymuconolactone decarboxylase family protein [Hyphomicrobiales bacterium]
MKNIAASIAISTLAATGVEAREDSMTRIAPAAVYEVAPGLGQFTDEVLFGEVWKRGELAPRDRSLVTVAALVSTGRTAQIGAHVGRALDNGVQPGEIGELITHLAFYSGWPNAMSAVAETKKVFDERKIGPVADSDAARIELEAAAEAARTATVDANVAPTAPILAELTNRVLFGDLWRRPDLSARDRSLVTMAALIAIGQPEQLPFHANRAMDNGLTRAEAAEVPAHLGFYAGWPRAMSAVPVLQKVFAAREEKAAEPPAAELQIVRADPNGGDAGPEAYFSGQVRVATRYQGNARARISGATVSFA